MYRKRLFTMTCICMIGMMLLASCKKESDEKQITRFAITNLTPMAEGVINQENLTITVNVPEGTDVTNLIPLVRVSDKATVLPESGMPTNFSLPVIYTVTAENGTTAKYTVTVVAGGGGGASTEQTFTVGGVSFKMIKVDGGTFTMGATAEQGTEDPYDDEYPTHSVTLSTYYMGETEVTQELWTAVMGENPSNFSGTNLPVEKVSWDDCQTFITKLNQMAGKTFRLPTEVEWEYAARGGNKSKGYKYAGSNTIEDVAWYSGNSESKTHAVKTKQANELGLYDMSGNVYEWCQDWYGDYTSEAQTNPQGPAIGSSRVLRGGGWINLARNCRVSFRNDIDPDYRSSYCGLRLVLSE